MAGSNHKSNRATALLITALLSLPLAALGGAFMLPPDIASQYSLSTSTSLPFPSATQSNSDTQNTLVNGWSLNDGRIQQGTDNIAFVSDPFPNYHLPSSASFPSPSGPVLQVTYAKDGFGSSGSGTQFYSLWNPVLTGSRAESCRALEADRMRIPVMADPRPMEPVSVPGLCGGNQGTVKPMHISWLRTICAVTKA